MRKFSAALLLGAALVSAVPAHAQMLLLGVGKPASGAAPPAYSGQGDLKTYDIWYGVYAYSAAARGGVALQACAVGDAGGCQDISTDATTGLLNVAAVNVNGSPCNDTTNVCTAKIVYNKGAQGATFDLTQATEANRATILVSCGGLTGSACLVGTTNTRYESGSNYTQAQPFTLVAVSRRNSSTSTDVTEISTTGVTLGGGFFNNNNDAYCTNSGIINPAAADATWHGKACTQNGTSSNFIIDATLDGDHDLGTNANSGHVSFMNVNGGGRAWLGRIASAGIAPSGFNTTELAAANAAAQAILLY